MLAVRSSPTPLLELPRYPVRLTKSLDILADKYPDCLPEKSQIATKVPLDSRPTSNGPQDDEIRKSQKTKRKSMSFNVFRKLTQKVLLDDLLGDIISFSSGMSQF